MINDLNGPIGENGPHVTGSPPSPRRSTGRGRPVAPEVVEALRHLVETTTLPMRVVAAQVGVSRPTVNKLAARHGWRRPRAARVSMEGQRGGGPPIVPEVVAQARALVEGTTLSYKAIGERLGVSTTALCRWRKRGRWVRPRDGVGPARPVRRRRGRGAPYAGGTVATVRDLVTGTLLSQKAIARQVGISQWCVSDWTRRHGWARPRPRPKTGFLGLARFGPAPAEGGGSQPPRDAFGDWPCFAAAKRTGPLEQTGDRRGRPYATATRREARAYYELTRLPTATIAVRLRVHPVTVVRWAREESWDRPRGRAGAKQLRGFFAATGGFPVR